MLRRRRVSVKILEIWLGHLTSIFMLQPGFLSCFYHIYRFIQRFRNRPAEMWREVRAEIRLALGVMWLSRTILAFDPIYQIDVGDSSGEAFALITSWGSTDEIAQACKWREMWRFRPIPDEI